MRGGMFWTKAVYTGLLGLGGYLAIERLGRPAGSGRRGWMLAGRRWASSYWREPFR
jgi:hypothetical protein